MLRLLIEVLGGWMAFSTVLGLSLARVIGSRQALEVRMGSRSRAHSRHAA
jgi:hypothetical protein